MELVLLQNLQLDKKITFHKVEQYAHCSVHFTLILKLINVAYIQERSEKLRIIGSFKKKKPI